MGNLVLNMRIDVRGIISIFYTAGVVETVRARGALLVLCIRAERKGVHNRVSLNLTNASVRPGDLKPNVFVQ